MDEVKLHVKIKMKNKSKILTYKEEIKKLNNEITILNNTINTIYDSTGWRILMRLYSFRDQILTINIIIKKHFKKKYNLIKKQNAYPIKVNTRKINLHSKKIIIVDHSYHVKTKSSHFLIELLKKYFDITFISDNSWKGLQFPNLSVIDESYIEVIFWQTLPPKSVISQIKNENLIIFPMYDANGSSPKEFWDQYSNFKIINFTKCLHNKLQSWGFDTIHIQYFPKPSKFIKNKKRKVFFWQRINLININTVEKLLGELKTIIHFHKSIDPGHSLTKPNTQQEKKYCIEYSAWFKSQKEIIKKIQECDIYIAPREYEGIGMSFLEAMAMGKAVVAPNNPSMNEYIINNKTGYLYNIKNIKEINFNNINEVRLNSYKYIITGYKKWLSDKNKIIKFIKQG